MNESADVQFLLDGLEVESIEELHGLVMRGRAYDYMEREGFEFTHPKLRSTDPPRPRLAAIGILLIVVALVDMALWILCPLRGRGRGTVSR